MPLGMRGLLPLGRARTDARYLRMCHIWYVLSSRWFRQWGILCAARAHAATLSPEANIRPVVSALSVPFLLLLPITLGLLHLNPRHLLAPG